MECEANAFGVFLVSFIAGGAIVYFYLKRAGKLVERAPKAPKGSGGGGGAGPSEQEN